MSKLGSATFREGTSHTKPITDIRWNADGSLLASASFDKSVKVASIEQSGNVIHYHNNMITFIYLIL
jgi:WD40 repeat protein